MDPDLRLGPALVVVEEFHATEADLAVRGVGEDEAGADEDRDDAVDLLLGGVEADGDAEVESVGAVGERPVLPGPSKGAHGQTRKCGDCDGQYAAAADHRPGGPPLVPFPVRGFRMVALKRLSGAAVGRRASPGG